MTPNGKYIVWLLLAAGLAAAAAALRPGLDRQAEALDITTPAVDEASPELSMISVATGGLRAPIINYLWLRANDLKEKGRFYDAYQLSDIICRLEPHFPGVFIFHSWNMAWNISAATHTEEERWLWVSNGMKLLRDRGIPYNPKSLALYRELGWIFYSKIGDTLDEMHWAYKRKWAAEMQHLLGSPPMGETKAVIGAFRPIAEAPLDRQMPRQGAVRIQPAALKTLLSDPNVQRYADVLAGAGLKMDESILDAYNRFSADDAAAVVRPVMGPAALVTDADRKQSQAINLPEHRQARNKILAFLRAQLLWNVYRMDPKYMLSLMERYQAPLDWRLPWPHSLYWATLGIETCNSINVGEVYALNTDREAMNSFRMLTWFGRLTYIENPEKPDDPSIYMMADWRYIAPAHEAHVHFAKSVIANRGEKFENSVFKDGHINYLTDAIGMLVTLHRYKEAQDLLDWIRSNYGKVGGAWDSPLAVDFIKRLYDNEGKPSPYVTTSQLTMALQTGYAQLAAGDSKGFAESMTYAQFVYSVLRRTTTERQRPDLLGEFSANMLRVMLIEPRAAGYNMSLVDRSQMYKGVAPIRTSMVDGLKFSLQAQVYDWVASALRPQCQDQGLDFDKAFPAPDDLNAFHDYVRRRMNPLQAPK